MDICQRGVEYKVEFDQYPLGFSVLKDENDRNACVIKVKSKARRKGVRIDSWLEYVGNECVWGLKHDDIIRVIRKQGLPKEYTFRMTPKLLNTNAFK